MHTFIYPIFLFASLISSQNKIDIKNLRISNYSWIKSGTYEEWYINRKKEQKGFWKHGNNEGLCSFWFENGKQKKKGFIKIPKGLVFGPIGTRMEISSAKDTEMME